MNNDNKQLKTLISWAKKYMDSTTTLNTTIEGVSVKLKTELVFEQLHLLVEVDFKSLDYYFAYNFNSNKWTKVTLK